jgi:hypothetical protein
MKWGMINKDGELILDTVYDEVEGFLEELCAVKQNGKWGFVNKSGAIVIPLMYDDLYSPVNNVLFAHALHDPEYIKRGFYEGFALVSLDDKWGYINPGNTPLGEGFVYAAYSTTNFSGGVAPVRKEVRGTLYSGLLANNGVYIVTPGVATAQGNTFGFIRPVYEGIAGANWTTRAGVVTRGLINALGQVMHAFAPGEYDLIQDFREGLGIVVKNNRIGFIDTSGREIIPPVFDTATIFINGLSKVSQGDKYGLVRSNGFYAIVPEYDDIHDFYDGHAVVRQGNLYGFVNSAGIIVRTPQYRAAGRFSNGLLPVQIGSLWGLIDNQGNEVVPAHFEMIGDYADELAPARSGNRWGYIDKTGEFVIAPVFLSAEPFSGGIAVVRTEDNKLTLIRIGG